MEPSSSRRRFISTALAGLATGLAGCGQQTAGPTDQGTGGTGTPAETRSTDTESTTDATPAESVGLETLASGFEAPLDVAFAPGGNRSYIADQVGVVSVYESNGLREEPFLDLRDSIEVGGEKGVLGIALHPEFAENGRVFVRYSAPSRSGTPADYSHTFILAEFTATDDGLGVDRESERAILEIPQPQANHNAGDIAFGPDGYLYVAVGDGGAAGDQGGGHVDDWYDGVGGGNGQDVTENLLGSILRIDVNEEGEDIPYAIPEDNPLVGSDGLGEHYAWGLRNPWKICFDGEDLYAADVGQNRYEEVNLIKRGGNYGWNVREGTHCYQAEECPGATPDDVRGGEPLRDPIVEYPHSGEEVSGNSIIGGHVYRGSNLAGFEGTYLFGDLNAGGELFAATRPSGDGGGDGNDGDGNDGEGDDGSDDEGGLWPTRVVEIADEDAGKLQRILSFGRDPNGEMYVLGTGEDSGGFHRIVPSE